MEQRQKQNLHYHRPFEKTGFVPLPDKQKKKPIKTMALVSKKQNFQEIKQIYDSTCEDCYDDCYEDKLNQILLYKLTGRCSLRIETIQSIKVRQHEQYNIAKNAENFILYTCQNGTYHLKENVHKVLMVREAFRLVAKVHGQFHLDGELMKLIIKTQYPWASSYHITDFILQFPLLCPYCRQFPALEAAFMPAVKSRIWFYLQPTRVDYEDDGQNEILTYSRPSTYFPYCISPNIQPIQVMLQELKQLKKHYASNVLDPYHCEPDTCQHDQYQAEYLICLFVFKENQYPLIKTNNHIGRLIHAIRAKIKQFQVRVCNQGTDHLWHKEKNMRILMKDQINTVLQILHNGNVPDSEAASQQGKGYFHRNQKLMRFMLEKQLGLYPYNIIAAMRPFLNKCPNCSRKKFYLEYKREQIVFEETQMVSFRLKLHDARKRYKATKQIPKILSYDQMLLKSEQMKADTMRIPTVVNGQIVDPNDSHPNDQQYSPQVKAMLQKYVDHPEMFQFFSNDSIWLIEFNEKRYPDSIADENIWIRKYAYDGMYRMIMITTESMRQNYLIYGECLCVDFIPMMIKRRSPSGRHFQIGFLTGMDCQNKTVVFGVCFMSEDLMIYHRKMFQFFFEMVGQIIPGTIITSSGKNLSQAVYLMKKQDPVRYRFNHYIGWFYVIEDLKKDLSGEYDRSEMLKQFCSLLVEANPITHQKRLIQITSQIVERTILQKFLKNKNKYCLSCLPAAFMGYAMQTKRVEDLYDHLTDSFIYQSRVAQFMLYIFKLQKKLNNKRRRLDPNRNLQIVSEAIATQINVADNVVVPEVSPEIMLQLVWLSEHLSENLLKNLMKNFVEARKIILLQDEDTIIRGDNCEAFFLDTDHLKYSVRYSTQDECWRCSCPWIYWTGIPCCHLIKMVIKMGGNIKYYVNQRWILDNQDEYHEDDNQNMQNEDKDQSGSQQSSQYGQQPVSKMQSAKDKNKQASVQSQNQSQQSSKSSKEQKSRGRRSMKEKDSARSGRSGKRGRKPRASLEQQFAQMDGMNDEFENMNI